MNTNRLPIFMKSYTDTWINLNPEYEYRFFDDNDIIELHKNRFPWLFRRIQPAKIWSIKGRFMEIFDHIQVWRSLCRY